MKSPLYVFPLVFLFVVSFTPLYAGDMTLEYEGREYVLLEDNTWDFGNRDDPDLEDNLFITLGDGRIVLIALDYSWRFVDKKELIKSNDNITVKFITAQGKAQNIDVGRATAAAKKKALANATKKLKASIKNKKLNYNKLMDCIRRVEKEEDSSESFTKGKGWSVTVKMTLDKGSIRAVLDCEGKKEEKKEEKAAPTK